MAEQIHNRPTRKVTVQAVVTVVTWLLIRFAGIEIPADVGLALNVILEAGIPAVAGFAAAYFVKPSAKDQVAA